MGADLLPRLAEHGLSGLVISIALWVIFQLYRSNEKSHEDRLRDAAEFRTKLEAVTTAYAAAQREMSEVHVAQLSELIRACTASITAQTHVTEDHRASLAELLDTFKEYVEIARRQELQLTRR